MAETTNADVASILDRFGSLLEISGESPFRVRAYHKAADAILDSPEAVSKLAAESRLREIEGVGEGLAAVIDEYVATGKIRELDNLERRFPATLIELTEVPGIGAKSVARLYKELGITDRAGLKAACASGSIGGVQGFTKNSVARITAGIESLERRTGRQRLGTALPFGRRLVADLRDSMPGLSNVEIAGSVRRMEETVADLDIVVETEDVESAVAVVRGLPSIAGFVERQSDRATYRLQNGSTLNVFFAEPGHFGSTLVRTTGNAGHLELLGDFPPATSEDVLYGRLGLPVIPPELRMGHDELDLARSGQIDKLVTTQDVKGEFHSHTLWSDGALSVLDMARAAAAHGYQFIGISDHTRSLGVANGLDVQRLSAQRLEIEAANEISGIRVFASAEVEVSRDGRLDFDDVTLAELDVVIASTHVGLRQPREELTARLISVLENPNVDIIAHPSGRLVEQREGGDFDFDRVFETAARTGTALEINADPARLDLSAENARKALAEGCLLTINCDAHHPESWNNLEFGVANARKAGARPDQILNCWPVDKIEAWLSARGGKKRK